MLTSQPEPEPQRTDPNAALLAAMRDRSPEQAAAGRTVQLETPPKTDDRNDKKTLDGCGDAAPFLGTSALAAPALDRSWTVHIPKRYDKDRRHAVLMLLHDDSETAEDILTYTGLAELADANDLVIIAPESPGSLAWREQHEIEYARDTFEITAATLCLDRSRVYALGHAAGGRVVEELVCMMPLAAMATTAFRRKPGHPACVPDSPAPYLILSGKEDAFSPIGGGPSCALTGGKKRSLARKEALWRERNKCSEKAPKRKTYKGGACDSWDCEAAVTSCRLDGGREWPKAPTPFWAVQYGIEGCIGSRNSFPFTETIWEFFRSAPAKKAN
jgi:polyhydroxybutyrate depolymerase